jgi:hypothetical protein
VRTSALDEATVGIEHHRYQEKCPDHHRQVGDNPIVEKDRKYGLHDPALEELLPFLILIFLEQSPISGNFVSKVSVELVELRATDFVGVHELELARRKSRPKSKDVHGQHDEKYPFGFFKQMNDFHRSFLFLFKFSLTDFTWRR